MLPKWGKLFIILINSCVLVSASIWAFVWVIDGDDWTIVTVGGVCVIVDEWGGGGGGAAAAADEDGVLLITLLNIPPPPPLIGVCTWIPSFKTFVLFVNIVVCWCPFELLLAIGVHDDDDDDDCVVVVLWCERSCDIVVVVFLYSWSNIVVFNLFDGFIVVDACILDGIAWS